MSQKMIKKQRNRKSRARRNRATRRMFVESLEDRRLMTADLGGNTLAAATNLGSLEGSREIADWVGRADINDYYRVRIGQQSDVRLGLDGLRADADLQLLNSSGQTIASSTRGGSNAESISRALQPGTYFVRVYPYSGDTNYRLTLNATPNQPTVPDYAGNSLGSARSLGVLSGERSYADFVGNSDRDDYYRFELAGRSTFELALDGLRADADVQLLDSSGRTITSSTRGGSQSESIRRTLDAGTYFVRVYRYSGDTNYRLTLRAEADGPVDNAGNTREQARNLGTLSGSVALNDFVGQADRADYYRFHVDSASNFRLRMDGMSADADVQLLDASGRYIAGSFRGGANAEAVDRVIESGDYFVQVFPYGSANTNYRLLLDVAAQPAALDLRTVSGFDGYDHHVGQDYMAAAGTAVLSPVSGRVVHVGSVDGYGTMAVAIEVTLPWSRSFASELDGTSVTTNRAIFVLGHLRPSRELVNHPIASERFRLGSGELTFGVDSWITAGQLLGYVESHGYEGEGSTGSHVHVTGSDANNPPGNIWRGRGLPQNDPLRARYIRPELAWSLLR
ncbi:MAG: pre-peptidase C-terminal domain-containing protein [Planctomycetota bacterium]|nr:pre-peptidase C-terminal domain-containing protein [Planctomycetota bacterium]